MFLPLGIGSFYTLSVGNVAPPGPSGAGGTIVGDQMACVRFVPSYTLEHPSSIAFSYTTTERLNFGGTASPDFIYCSVSIYGPNPSSPLLYTTGPLEAGIAQSVQVSVPYTEPIRQGSDYNLCWGCSVASGSRQFGQKSCTNTTGANMNIPCTSTADCPGTCTGGTNNGVSCLVISECPGATACTAGNCLIQNSTVTVLGGLNNTTTSILANTSAGFIGPPVQVGVAKNLMASGAPPATTGNISNSSVLPGLPLVVLRQE